MTESHDEQLAGEWYDRKTAIMESLLGKEHNIVMHAMVPYGVGGALDLYYYPDGIAGTAVATKELSELPGEGSSNDLFDTYEVVMFTRQPLSLDDAQDEATPFGRAHQTINAILNCMARYSAQATLNPRETCEFPEEMETVGGKCLIFDAYGPAEESAEFGLMALIEVHRSEMEYAMQNGGQELLDMLKEAGHYPYSDLDREAVV